MSVLVTGGTGLLGSHISRQLAIRGDRVIAFDVSPSIEAIYDITDMVKIVHASVMDLGALVKIIKEEEVDRIIHTAAVMYAESTRRDALEVNIEGTINVCEAARLMDLERIVYTSTRAIYGPQKGKLPIKEEYQGRPEKFYDITKLAGELFGHCWAKNYGIDFKALRVGGLMYGFGMKPVGNIRVAFKEIVEKPLLGKCVVLELEEFFRMDMVHAKDVARAHLCVLDAKPSSIKSNALNVGTGEVHTFQDVADIMRKLIPNSEIQITVRPGAATREALPLDSSRIREELGFFTEYDLEKGVKDYVDDFRKQVK